MTNRKKSAETTYGLFHNPGYDFLRLTEWMKESQIDPSRQTIAPYFFPVLALLGACFAIEGYVNMVGQKVDPKWGEFDKGPVPIKDRIAHIYEKLEKTVDFGSGNWQEVTLLFKMRVALVHPKYVSQEEPRKEKITDVFEDVGAKYPIQSSQEVAKNAIDTLLDDSGLSNLREFWMFKTYHGPPRE